MAIILDTDDFSDRSYRTYLEKALFSALVKQLPHEQFWVPAGSHLLSEQAFSNVHATPFPSQRGFFAQKRTGKWLHQCNASAFISFNRTLKTDVPVRQVFLIDTEPGLASEKAIAGAGFIGFTSKWLKATFIEKYPSFNRRLFLAEGFLEELHAPDIFEDQLIKDELTEGKEYFICTDFYLDEPRLTTLLKGFSTFKKRLQSSWKLVVILRSAEAVSREKAGKLLAGYKYRADVVLTDEDRLPQKLKAAYCLVNLNDGELFPVEISEAAGTGTPIISLNTNSLKSIYTGEGMVYLPDGNSGSIGEKLIDLYKNEALRRQMAKATADIKTSFFKTDGLDTFISLLKQEQVQ